MWHGDWKNLTVLLSLTVRVYAYIWSGSSIVLLDSKTMGFYIFNRNIISHGDYIHPTPYEKQC